MPPETVTPLEAWLDCVAGCAHRTEPYDHWLLDRALPDPLIRQLAALPFAGPPTARFEGRREEHNATRVYFNPANRARYPACKQTARLFGSPQAIAALEELTGADLSQGQLRIEYCQDIDGFWLEPHRDVSAKLLTLLIYLSNDPDLADAGTDIYGPPPDHAAAGRAPFAASKGLIFIPGETTWHGFTPRPIRCLRKSIIVNYVSRDWRSREELAFPED